MQGIRTGKGIGDSHTVGNILLQIGSQMESPVAGQIGRLHFDRLVRIGQARLRGGETGAVAESPVSRPDIDIGIVQRQVRQPAHITPVGIGQNRIGRHDVPCRTA